ncbi:MAG TPA: DUF4180 domain-containing protein [Dehalococcoidia bacterium]|jgi:hypothetical protein
MNAQLVEIGGERCLVVGNAAAVLRDVRGATDLIGEAMSERATMIVMPATKLDDAFFQLRSGLAGEVLQKAANYRLKFAVIGDISAHVAASEALRDFVVESNRGNGIFFVEDMAALEERLSALPPD